MLSLFTPLLPTCNLLPLLILSLPLLMALLPTWNLLLLLILSLPMLKPLLPSLVRQACNMLLVLLLNAAARCRHLPAVLQLLLQGNL
jgi:hypothetical protein